METGTLAPSNAPTCSAWREVSKEEFFRVIGPQDVSPSIVSGKWPYTSNFVTRNRQVRGKCVGYLPEGSVFESKKYYLPNP